MTDKERLEGITSRYVNSILNDGYQRDTVTITTKDYLYLIKQAERVRELERQLENQKKHKMTYRKIAKEYHGENKRYREAFEELKYRAMNVTPLRDEDGSIIEDEEARFIYEFCKEILEESQC